MSQVILLSLTASLNPTLVAATTVMLLRHAHTVAVRGSAVVGALLVIKGIIGLVT